MIMPYRAFVHHLLSEATTPPMAMCRLDGYKVVEGLYRRTASENKTALFVLRLFANAVPVRGVAVLWIGFLNHLFLLPDSYRRAARAVNSVSAWWKTLGCTGRLGQRGIGRQWPSSAPRQSRQCSMSISSRVTVSRI